MLPVYEPKERYGHTTVRVGDSLYMWGGCQPSLPNAHKSEEKRLVSSAVEVFHLPTRKWEQKPTTGNPPLGVSYYAATAIGREIFYFGGHCNHDESYHNSLYSLNADTLNWTEHSSSTCTTSQNGPQMKRCCGMVAVKIEGEDYLAVFGGEGQSSNCNSSRQPGAQYKDKVKGYCHSNEIHYYKLSSGQWIFPNVTGDRPSPIDSFSLTSIDDTSAILFGGVESNGVSDKIYVFKFTSNSMVEISEMRYSYSPEGRCAHSSVLINTISGPLLLLLGGNPISDCWLLNINDGLWFQMNLSESNNSARYDHSLSVWHETPTTTLLIEFGGQDEFGEIFKNTALIEINNWGNASQSKVSTDIWKKEFHNVQFKLQNDLKESRQLLQRKDIQLKEKEEELKRVKIAQEKDSQLMLNQFHQEKKELQLEIKSLQQKLHDQVKVSRDIGVQFDYHLSHPDSGGTMAGQKTFLIQGDNPQSFHWEKYGFRLHCPKGAVPKHETTEMAVSAIFGGNFKFPKDTLLVSAVYAISVGKPLLKRLRIELQHCVDLKNTRQTHCLKFVHASSFASCQFSPVEGGSFSVHERYGSIERSQFSGYAIVTDVRADEDTFSGSSDGESAEGSTVSDTDSEYGTPSQGSEKNDDVEELSAISSSLEVQSCQKSALGITQIFDQSLTEHESLVSSCHALEIVNADIPVHGETQSLNGGSHGIKKDEATQLPIEVTYSDILYTGKTCHEKQGEGFWKTTFVVAEDLEVIKTFLNDQSSAEKDDDDVIFSFRKASHCIELGLDAPQQPGWTVNPNKRPTKIRQFDIHKRQKGISLFYVNADLEDPATKKPLHYIIPLIGATPEVSICINRVVLSQILTPDSSISKSLIASTCQSRRESTFRSEIAYKVMTGSISLIKNCGLDLQFLTDQLLENSIINEREKSEIIDDHTKKTDGERMDKLFHIISSSINMEGEVFGIFIDILKKENTRRTTKLAEKLLEKYNLM